MQEHILTIKSWYDVVFKSDGLTVHPTHYFSFSFFGEETPYFSYCELDELLELISNSSNSSNDIFTLFMVLNYNFAPWWGISTPACSVHCMSFVGEPFSIDCSNKWATQRSHKILLIVMGSTYIFIRKILLIS